MKIFQIEYRDETDEHKGGYFCEGIREARREMKRAKTIGQTCEVTTHEFRVTRQGLLKALNQLATHPNNG